MERRLCLVVSAIAMIACGARTSLATEARGGLDAGTSMDDARDAGTGESADSGLDATTRLDATTGLDATECVPTTRLERLLGNVVFVIDRSGSMGRPLGVSGLTRDAALRMALAASLPSLETEVEIGALLFPVAAPTSTTTPICRLSPAELDVALGLGHAGAVLTALDMHPPVGGTPTAEAVARAHAAIVRTASPAAPAAIVLATDGGPNCNPSGIATWWYGVAPEGCLGAGIDIALCLDTERAVAAIHAAHSAGIPTYVVGMDVTLPFLVDALDAMAAAGGRARDGVPRFFDAGRPDALLEAVTAITSEVRCAFAGGGVLDLPSGAVHVDGEAVPPGSIDGWEPTARGAIQLLGSACESALRPGALVTFERTCPP